MSSLFLNDSEILSAPFGTAIGRAKFRVASHAFGKWLMAAFADRCCRFFAFSFAPTKGFVSLSAADGFHRVHRQLQLISNKAVRIIQAAQNCNDF